MNHSKLYIPNPQKWIDFFDRVSKGVTSLNQSGGSRQSRVISIGNSGGNQTTAHLSLKAVSPSEQTVQQAKSELERDHIKPSVVAEMIQKPRKRRQRRTARSGKIKKITKRQKGAGRKKNKKLKIKRRSGKSANIRRRSGKSNNIRRKDIFGII